MEVFRVAGITQCRSDWLAVCTYNDVNWEENNNCPVSSPVSVCQEGPNKWCEEASAGPGRGISRGSYFAFVEHSGEIGHYILCDCKEGRAFTEFNT